MNNVWVLSIHIDHDWSENEEILKVITFDDELWSYTYLLDYYNKNILTRYEHAIIVTESQGVDLAYILFECLGGYGELALRRFQVEDIKFLDTSSKEIVNFDPE